MLRRIRNCQRYYYYFQWFNPISSNSM